METVQMRESCVRRLCASNDTRENGFFCSSYSSTFMPRYIYSVYAKYLSLPCQTINTNADGIWKVVRPVTTLYVGTKQIIFFLESAGTV